MTEKIMSKWEIALSKLLEYTQDDQLRWRVVNSSEILPGEDLKDAALLTQYENRSLLLYREAFTKPTFSVGISLIGTLSSEAGKDYRARLCIFDVQSKTIVYAFPHSQLTEDLYKAATYNAANVDDFLDSILEPKSKVIENQKSQSKVVKKRNYAKKAPRT